MSTTPETCLFVYGTLLTTAIHPMGKLLRDNSDLLGHGSIRARLYIIDDPDLPGQNEYPGAVPSHDPAERVYGEVYSLLTPELILERFDDYEACSPRWPEPHEFMRRNVEVAMADGGTLRAVSYLYTWDIATARHVPSGRFTEAAPNVR